LNGGEGIHGSKLKLKLKLKLEFPIASKYYYIVVPDLVGGARLALNYYAMTSTGL